MAATIEQTIRVTLKGVIEGLPELKVFAQVLRETRAAAGARGGSGGLDAIGKSARGTGNQSLFMAGAVKVLRAAMSPLVGSAKLFINALSTIMSQVQSGAAALILFIASAPAVGFTLLIKEGLQFNSVMEQQEIGLAALIQATHDLFKVGGDNKPLQGVEAYNAATTIAEAATSRLRIKIIPLRATSEQLLPLFNQVVTAGAAAGLTIEQLEDTFVSLAAAAQILSIPTERLGTEIRLLLGGVTRETSRLGPALFGSAAAAREFVKQHRAAGDLFQALQVKLVSYNAALDKSEQSYETLRENTVEVFQVLAGIATSGLFEKIKAGLSLITRGFFDLHAGKLKPEFEALFNYINNALSQLGDFLVDLVGRTIAALTALAKYVQVNSDYVSLILGDLVNIAEHYPFLETNIFTITGDLNEARQKTVSWHEILRGIARYVALMRDLMRIEYGLVEVIGSLIGYYVLGVLQLVLNVLGLISDKATDVSNAIASVRTGLHDFAESGAVRVAHGISFEASRAAAIDNRGRFRFSTTSTPGTDPNSFLAKLRRGPASGAGGRGGRDRSADKLAESVRSLSDSKLDLALATFEARVSRVKFLMDNAKAALDRQLKDHLLSITDYYNKLLDVEKTTINAEIAQQQALREREIKRVDAKVAELEAKRNNSKKPNEKEAFGNEIAAERNKLAAKLVDYDERIAELTGKVTAAEFENAAAAKDKLNSLRDQGYEIEKQLLAIQHRSADSDLIDIAGQFSDQLLNSLSNLDAGLGEPIKKTIEDINVLGRVTSQQLKSILSENGVEIDKLGTRTQHIIQLMERLEDNAKFKGLQEGIQQSQDRLDQTITEILAKYRDLPNKQDQANREIITAIQASSAEISGLLDKAEALAQVSGDAGFLLYIRRIKSELADANHVTNDFAANVNGVVRNAFSNFVDSVAEGNDSIFVSFRKMCAGILIGVAKLIVQTLILNKLFAALGLSADKGFGGFLAGVFGVAAKPVKKADGGFIGGPGASISRHQAAATSLMNGSFAPALRPLRLSSGGFVGSLEGRTADQGAVATRQANISNLIKKLESNGERTILNVIGRNRTEVIVPA